MSGIVIMGGGLAGGRTARTVRELGYSGKDARIVVRGELGDVVQA